MKDVEFLVCVRPKNMKYILKRFALERWNLFPQTQHLVKETKQLLQDRDRCTKQYQDMLDVYESKGEVRLDWLPAVHEPNLLYNEFARDDGIEWMFRELERNVLLLSRLRAQIQERSTEDYLLMFDRMSEFHLTHSDDEWWNRGLFSFQEHVLLNAEQPRAKDSSLLQAIVQAKDVQELERVLLRLEQRIEPKMDRLSTRPSFFESLYFYYTCVYQQEWNHQKKQKEMQKHTEATSLLPRNQDLVESKEEKSKQQDRVLRLSGNVSEQFKPGVWGSVSLTDVQDKQLDLRGLSTQTLKLKKAPNCVDVKHLVPNCLRTVLIRQYHGSLEWIGNQTQLHTLILEQVSAEQVIQLLPKLYTTHKHLRVVRCILNGPNDYTRQALYSQKINILFPQPLKVLDLSMRSLGIVRVSEELAVLKLGFDFFSNTTLSIPRFLPFLHTLHIHEALLSGDDAKDTEFPALQHLHMRLGLSSESFPERFASHPELKTIRIDPHPENKNKMEIRLKQLPHLELFESTCIAKHFELEQPLPRLQTLRLRLFRESQLLVSRELAPALLIVHLIGHGASRLLLEPIKRGIFFPEQLFRTLGFVPQVHVEKVDFRIPMHIPFDTKIVRLIFSQCHIRELHIPANTRLLDHIVCMDADSRPEKLINLSQIPILSQAESERAFSSSSSSSSVGV